MKNINKEVDDKEKRGLVYLLNLVTTGFTPYILLVLIIFGLYFQSLFFGITRLDDNQILSNANSMMDRNIAFVAFSTDAVLSNQGIEFYRPVQGLSFLIDAKLGKTNPYYFHLSNLIIHILTSCFLFYLIFLFNNDKKISFLLALIYSVHPLFNQAVIWLPSRGDLLVTLFSLISFISFIKFSITKKYIYFLVNIITFFIAIFSKEIAIFLPLIFLQYYYLKKNNLKDTFCLNNLILTLIWSLIIILYLVSRSYVVHESINSDRFGLNPLFHNLPVIPEFISKFFIPYNLSVLPEFNIIVITLGLTIITCSLLIMISRKILFKDNTLVFISWFLLFTVSAMLYRHEHLNNSYDYLEHRAYMPLIGILSLISTLKINQKKMKIVIVSSFFIFFIFSGITLTRSPIFYGPLSFFTSAIENGSKVVIAYNNRGLYKKEISDNYGALQDFDRAIELKPNYADAYNNRGIVKSNLKDNYGAEADYNRAISLKPEYLDAYNNRAMIRSIVGDKIGALSDLNKIIQLRPDFQNAWCSRGDIKKDLGEFDGAQNDYNHAIELNPNYAEAYFNRGFVKSNLGDFAGALKDYNQSIELKPDFAFAFKNRGLLKIDLGDSKSAMLDLDKAISLNPNYPEALFYRGNLKMDSGDYQGAKDDYIKAINLKHDYLEAYNNLGIICFKLKDYQNSLKFFEKALEINPNYTDAIKNIDLAKQLTRKP